MSLDKEYLPITGLADFAKGAAKLAFGQDSQHLAEGRVSILISFQLQLLLGLFVYSV